MIGKLRRYFEQQLTEATEAAGPSDREHAYQLATAALLVEMTRADAEVTEIEESAVTAAIRRAFDLDDAEAAELIALAEERADEATSLYEFTRLINDHFGDPDKQRVVELLWHVAYADGALDRYEEHLVRRVADLIYVPHASFIRAKLKVRDELRDVDA